MLCDRMSGKYDERRTLLRLWSTPDVVCPLLVVVLGIHAAAGVHERAGSPPDLMTNLPSLQPLPVGLAGRPVRPTAPEVASPPITKQILSIFTFYFNKNGISF